MTTAPLSAIGSPFAEAYHIGESAGRVLLQGGKKQARLACQVECARRSPLAIACPACAKNVRASSSVFWSFAERCAPLNCAKSLLNVLLQIQVLAPEFSFLGSTWRGSRAGTSAGWVSGFSDAGFSSGSVGVSGCGACRDRWGARALALGAEGSLRAPARGGAVPRSPSPVVSSRRALLPVPGPAPVPERKQSYSSGPWRFGQPPIPSNRAQRDETYPRRSMLRILSLPVAQNESAQETDPTQPPGRPCEASDFSTRSLRCPRRPRCEAVRVSREVAGVAFHFQYSAPGKLPSIR